MFQDNIITFCIGSTSTRIMLKTDEETEEEQASELGHFISFLSVLKKNGKISKLR
jgi:hypothetical protein